jgi:hemerythrin superfamily protein
MLVSNPIDLLKIEHIIIKNKLNCIKLLFNANENIGWEEFSMFHNFLIKWHAYIEDKYIFPLFGEIAKPLSNDHLLIEKYGNNILNFKKKDWIDRYINIVINHNIEEERKLFPMKINLDKVMEEIITEKDRRIEVNYKDLIGEILP